MIKVVINSKEIFRILPAANLNQIKMPKKIKMPAEETYEEEDDGHMPDWKRKKNLEKLQQLKVFRNFKL